MGLKIGLTGNMGSGKSTVAREMSRLGAMVYYSDIHAKRQMKNPDVASAIKSALGDSVMNGEEVDRKKLGEVIFSDQEAMQKVRDIMVPVIKDEFEQWCKMFQDSVCVLESAIIVECGMTDMFDKIVVVCAEDQTKAQRAVKRDGMTIGQVKSILACQMPQAELVKHADFVINNDGDVPNLGWVVRSVMQVLESISKEGTDADNI
jgi:dephospho-CoA kinase